MKRVRRARSQPVGPTLLATSQRERKRRAMLPVSVAGSLTISLILPFGSVDRIRSTIEAAVRSLSVLSGRIGSRDMRLDDDDPRTVAVKSFVSARCERTSAGMERANALLAAYGAWASENGMQQLTAKSLAQGLMALGFRSRRSSVMFWHGLRLRQRAARRAIATSHGSQKPGGSNVA